MPCEAFCHSRGKSWNQKIISFCIVRGPTRWDYSRKSVGLWYFSRSCWESFEKFWKVLPRSQTGLKKWAALPPWFKPWSPVIRQRRLLCPLWLLSFSLMFGGETILHLKDGSLQSFPFFFRSCFTQVLGLSTHTKWEVCVSASDMSDGWQERKPEKKNERIYLFIFKGGQEEPCSAG